MLRQGKTQRIKFMDKQNQHLLSDEQVRRFIADGFIIIDSKLSSDFHQRVSQQIAYALEYELPHPGDNIVLRVPLLNRLSTPAAVQGALTSVLGEDSNFYLIDSRITATR